MSGPPSRGWGRDADTTDGARPGSRGDGPVPAATPSHGYADSSRGERLQKVLALAGVASRRACEALILAGEVTVNGTPVTELPAWVDPKRDRLMVSGRSVRTSGRLIYVMLYKPRGVVSTAEDPKGRQRAIDLVDHPSQERLFPIGRLDVDSSGLLLLTNDGELSNMLSHPRFGVHKVYEVTVAGEVSNETLRQLERGIWLSDLRATHGSRPGRRTGPSRLKIVHREAERTRLLMDLSEGRNRQIRRMMRDVGHRVRRLRRIQIGPLHLKHLRPGQWRDLLPREIETLRRAAEEASRPGPPAKGGAPRTRIRGSRAVQRRTDSRDGNRAPRGSGQGPPEARADQP
ncbi:MAG: rRNA pseudouridine synthase [Phycisphaeraceae bacterium]|nr:rRNA pseudouridine synthase [Phycisphaeraceae bacterium]